MSADTENAALADSSAGSAACKESLQTVASDRNDGAALPGVEEIVEALKPFAAVADLDIGDSELDFDYFMPATGHNKAPRLTVGNLRRAAAICARLAACGTAPEGDKVNE